MSELETLRKMLPQWMNLSKKKRNNNINKTTDRGPDSPECLYVGAAIDTEQCREWKRENVWRRKSRFSHESSKIFPEDQEIERFRDAENLNKVFNYVTWPIRQPPTGTRLGSLNARNVFGLIFVNLLKMFNLVSVNGKIYILIQVGLEIERKRVGWVT